VSITVEGTPEDILMKVFISGVTSGLGRALAEEFSGQGHNVWGVGRRQPGASQENLHYSVCDVSKLEEVRRVYAEMRDKGFIPDIVILNAGIMKDDLIPEFSYSVFKETIDINLFGAINWIDVFLPIFLKRKRGTFVAISSLCVYRGLVVNKIAYPASKAAVSAAFENLRLQFFSSGVRFITFHIGPMGKESSLFKIDYETAAERIARYLRLSRKPETVNFPLLPTLITKISKFLPDTFISKRILRISSKGPG
jgi:pentatricopeptide repeat protein